MYTVTLYYAKNIKKLNRADEKWRWFLRNSVTFCFRCINDRAKRPYNQKKKTEKSHWFWQNAFTLSRHWSQRYTPLSSHNPLCRSKRSYNFRLVLSKRQQYGIVLTKYIPNRDNSNTLFTVCEMFAWICKWNHSPLKSTAKWQILSACHMRFVGLIILDYNNNMTNINMGTCISRLGIIWRIINSMMLRGCAFPPRTCGWSTGILPPLLVVLIMKVLEIEPSEIITVL